jgi:hypothetical protein
MKGTLLVALVLALVAAAPVTAQDQAGPLQTSLRAAAIREGVLFAQSTAKSAVPSTPTPPRSWRKRHPAAFGAIVGSIAGAAISSVWLAANCHGGGEGVCSPPGAAMWTGMFAGLGAGSGAAIGAVVAR